MRYADVMVESPPWRQQRYIDAYRFAAEAHRGQIFPGTDGLPYVMHVSMVAMEVMTALALETFEAPDLAVQCALLHDTIEDTGVSPEDLEGRFGAAVAAGVAALSKDPSLPKPEQMADSLRRICQQPREVWIVKLADRISNLQPPPARWSKEKRTRYRDEAENILDALGPASPYLAARMRRMIDGYQAHIDAAT